MLYEKFKAFKMQIKGTEKKDTLEVYPEEHGLNETSMSSFYPQVSDDYLLYLGEKKGNWNIMEAVLMAAYNQPVSP